VEARLQLEQRRGHRGGEEDRDLREDRHRRRVSSEAHQLRVGGVAVEVVPDADREVRPGAGSGHMHDAGIFQVVPELPHGGGGVLVESQLESVRHRRGS